MLSIAKSAIVVEKRDMLSTDASLHKHMGLVLAKSIDIVVHGRNRYASAAEGIHLERERETVSSLCVCVVVVVCCSA